MDDVATLSEQILKRLSDAATHVLNASFYRHTLREIGVDLGREVAEHVRRSPATVPVPPQETYLRCLEWINTHWGWNLELKGKTKDAVHISVPHCPFGPLTTHSLDFCQIEAGMLGGLAGDVCNYGKVTTCQGPGTPPCDCSLTVHLRPTAQSMLIEGPTFPLVPQKVKPAHTAGHEAQMFAALSPRERELLRLIGEGLSDREIAGRLHLSVRTVEGHAARVRAKTSLRTRAALIRLALRLNTSA